MIRLLSCAALLLAAASLRPAAATQSTAPAPAPATAPPLPLSVDRAAARALAAEIDAALAAAWREQSLEPAPPADDATWMRRLSLDLRGVIPTADEVAAFLADPAADKREALLDAWLIGPDFARHLSYVWANVLFATAPRERQRTEALLRPWLEEQFAAGVPFAAIVEGVVAGTEWTRNPSKSAFVLTYQDSIETLAGAVARSFLGLQIQCAQCHDHPFDDWKQVEFNRFTGFFVDVRSDHTAGPGNTTLFRIVDRSPEWDFQERLTKLVQQARRPAGGMGGGMAGGLAPKAEGDALVFEDDLTGADGGMSGAMMARARTDAGQLAALEELLAVAKRTKKRENVLRTWESDPEQLAALQERLPLEARDLIQRYRDRRAAFSEAGFLDGTPAGDDDAVARRAQLAAWITRPDNRWHGRAIANRVVAELLGRGLVEPVDDLTGEAAVQRLPELHARLAAAFVEKSDLRLLYGALARTRAYAAGASPLQDGAERLHAEQWFAAQPLRPFTAEQLLFSLVRATSADSRAAIGGDDELEAFAAEKERKGRVDTLKAWCRGDLASGKAQFEPGIPAALYLMNGETTARAAPLRDDPQIAPLFEPGPPSPAALDALFRRTLSRPPTAAERDRFLAALADPALARPRAVEDLLWALLNATEFHTRR
ncbi:MAG: DUF1549 domain-containing protein [Planctomycetes bacterium]|nr:DUF1549 domain-containing protein [Planctomycetota bacterium]